MATIRKYRGKINVQIRKKGYPFISKSFTRLTTARKWAKGVEADMERHLHVVIPDDTTVGELLERYTREVLPTQQASYYPQSFSITGNTLVKKGRNSPRCMGRTSITIGR